MKVLVSGSRSIKEISYLEDCIKNSGFKISKLVCGYDPQKKLPKGVDELAYNWAKNKGIPTETYPADWDNFGLSAGPLRNKTMVEISDALIAIWDGKSKGTLGTINFWKQKVKAVTGDETYNCKIFKKEI